MSKYSLILLLAFAPPAAGDFVTELWGNDASCHHRPALKGAGKIVEFDLSALPRGAKVHRAILRADFRRRGYTAAVRVFPLPVGAVISTCLFFAMTGQARV